MWAKAGSVIPYLPLKSLHSLVGVATKQYEYLGFKLIPGHALDHEGVPRNHSHAAVYEDDGNSTAYLDGSSHVYTMSPQRETPLSSRSSPCPVAPSRTARFRRSARTSSVCRTVCLRLVSGSRWVPRRQYLTFHLSASEVSKTRVVLPRTASGTTPSRKMKASAL